ncbi:GNAT family N-acetyltransferase [Massilia niastensis]|uniref:GNAT family N-acetyltransferase n=1 Tax=Massilia niastensis TaxID=544911 RepID=UPI0003802B8D|nr:GNAT family N-acetyltransferase [Massilia niastensis]
MNVITIRQASVADVALVAPLFNAYRQFYGKPDDLRLAEQFLRERLQNGESTVLLALDTDGNAAGFTQLYPSFSSVSARRIYILNDLFVAPFARRASVGRHLLEAAAAFGREQGVPRLSLSTARINSTAQALYASAGWVRDDQYFSYSLEL